MSWVRKVGVAAAAAMVCCSPALAAKKPPRAKAAPPPTAPAPPPPAVNTPMGQVDRLLGRPTSDPLTTFLPKGAMDDFIVAQFDIRTVNSSLNIGRESYQARLMEVGYRPQPRRRPIDPLVLNGPNGTITMSLFERGDHNLDLIEDVLICFVDRNRTSGVTNSQILVLQKYSDTTPLVALAVAPDDPRCPAAH